MRKQAMGVILALSVGAGLSLAQPVSAQETPQQPVEVTDSLLEDFVEIYPTVMEVSQKAQVEMSEASSAEEAQEIQAEANEQITAILEEADMTLREYDGVIRAINDDPALMEKFRTQMEEIHGDEGGPGA